MSKRREIVTSPEFIPPPNWGRKNDGTKFGFDVKDYTDELVAAIEELARAARSPSFLRNGVCFCNHIPGNNVWPHIPACRKLRKLVKAAKGRYRRRSHEQTTHNLLCSDDPRNS